MKRYLVTSLHKPEAFTRMLAMMMATRSIEGGRLDFFETRAEAEQWAGKKAREVEESEEAAHAIRVNDQDPKWHIYEIEFDLPRVTHLGAVGAETHVEVVPSPSQGLVTLT